MVRFALIGTTIAVSVFGVGCVAQSDEAERFREPLPQQSEVALRVPGAEGGGGVRAQGLRIQTASAGETARYYQFTRDITNVVDFGTAFILGMVWTIAHTQPTTIEAKKAVWGPGSGNALEPAIWRFTVIEIGDREYDYALEGQPKSGGSWLTVLHGHGYGKTHPLHRTGWFEADNDAYRVLEPTRAKDYGTTKVTYDLVKLPATVSVALRPGAGKGEADITVVHQDGGAGSVDITARGDLDSTKATLLEDINLTSRWTAAGSGRADVTMMNGDLTTTVEATECWSDTFARVYYEDSVDFEPTTGDVKACVLTAP